MSTLTRWFLIPLLLVLATAAHARDWQEVARETQIAQANIQAAQKLISQSEGKAQEALDKVRTAQHFEGPQWVDLEKAMKEYNETFRQQLGVIDVNVKHMLQVNPSAQVPTVDTNPPQFKASVKTMEAIRDDIKATIIKAKKFKAARMLDDAKVRGEMLDRTEQQYYDTALNLAGIPLNSDGSINYGDIIAGLLPGPSGLINTGLSLTFGLYYYADEMKSGVRQIKTFKDMMNYADQAITNAEGDLRSAEQGLGYLNGYWQQKEDLMKEFYKVRNSWGSTADQSRQARKEEEIKEFEQQLEKSPYTKEIGNYDPPLMASEFEPEAKSAVRELESAALAAMQGGDPDAYASLVASYFKKYSDQYEQAQKNVKTAQEAANKAWQVASAAIDAASKAFWATVRQNCDSRCWDAAASRYYAAYNAAWNGYRPFMAAVLRAQREQTRISMARSIIENGADQLSNQMYNYAYTATNNLNMKVAQASETIQAKTADVGAYAGAIPYSWSLYSIKNYVGGLDEHVSSAFYWGTSPSGLLSELQAYADSVRSQGERAHRALPEYRKAISEAKQTAISLNKELNQALDKDAMIIASYRDGSLQNLRWPWWGSSPWQRQHDNRKEDLDSQRKYFDQILTVYERDDLDKVSSFDFEGMARQIEQKADEIGSIVDRINTFNYRLAMVSPKLDKVSRTLTKQGLYQPRPKSAQDLANEELTTGNWSSLVINSEALLKQLDALKQPGYPYFLTSYVGVRPRLLAAQNILYVAAMNKMRNYISLHEHGGFTPVPPDDFKKLDEAWKQLEPLYGQFDSLAMGERVPLQAAQKDLPDNTSLNAAYGAIPSGNRGVVSGQYQRYGQEYNYLNGYIGAKLASLETLSDTSKNNVLGLLQDWIGGYPAAYQAWRELQARLEKEAEERQRQYEEQKKKQAQDNLAAVQALYPSFVAAYQQRNLKALLKMLDPHWQASDGTDVIELEDTLSNSFRIFDTISFSISGLNVQAQPDGTYVVKYSVDMVGTIRRMNIKHEEKSDITDIVTVTPDGPVISRTSGGSLWIK